MEFDQDDTQKSGEKKASIDQRYSPPSAAQIERWIAWCAPAGDTDASTLSDDNGE